VKIGDEINRSNSRVPPPPMAGRNDNAKGEKGVKQPDFSPVLRTGSKYEFPSHRSCFRSKFWVLCKRKKLCPPCQREASVSAVSSVV
jgi:hypothetical protein